MGLLVALGCLAIPSVALAGPSDTTATSAYLRADRVFLHQVSGDLPAGQAAANTLVGQVTAECPGAAAQAPSGQDLDEFGLEALLAVGIAFERPMQTATLTFAREIQHLRWSNPKLTRLVHLYAATKRTEVAFAPPPLCSALKEWVASNYGALPKSTTSALRAAFAAASPEEEILTLLGPYAHAKTKTVLRSVKSLEARTELALVKVAVPAVVRLQEGLGLRRVVAPSPQAS